MTVHVIGEYGAMQMGTHIDLWKREGDDWKLARVISYDHVLAK